MQHIKNANAGCDLANASLYDIDEPEYAGRNVSNYCDT